MHNASLSSKVLGNKILDQNQTFTVGTASGTNQSGKNHVAYCFKSVKKGL